MQNLGLYTSIFERNFIQFLAHIISPVINLQVGLLLEFCRNLTGSVAKLQLV